MDRRHLLERGMMFLRSFTWIGCYCRFPCSILQGHAITVSGYYGVLKETILGTNSRLRNFHPLLLSQGR